MNQYSPRLIIAPITSNIGKVYPFEVFITRGVGGLEKDSKIMLDQIRSLDKRRLVKKIGAINREMLVKVCLVAQKLISAE
jgi:mRNA interferase MazF